MRRGNLPAAARSRVQEAAIPDRDRTHRREIVDAFLAASRGGDFEALLAVLDPDVVLRAEATAVHLGAAAEVRGPASLAAFFKKRSRGAQRATIDGEAGAVWAPGARIRVVFVFTFAAGRISAIDLVADPERFREFDVAIIEDWAALRSQIQWH